VEDPVYEDSCDDESVKDSGRQDDSESESVPREEGWENSASIVDGKKPHAICYLNFKVKIHRFYNSLDIIV